MTEDIGRDISEDKISTWNSSREPSASISYHIPSSDLNSFSPPPIDNTYLREPNKDFSLPQHEPQKIISTWRSQTKPSEAIKPASTTTAAASAPIPIRQDITIDHTNPLGEINKNIPKPPKFATVTKLRSSASFKNLWMSKNSPSLSPTAKIQAGPTTPKAVAVAAPNILPVSHPKAVIPPNASLPQTVSTKVYPSKQAVTLPKDLEKPKYILKSPKLPSTPAFALKPESNKTPIQTQASAKETETIGTPNASKRQSIFQRTAKEEKTSSTEPGIQTPEIHEARTAIIDPKNKVTTTLKKERTGIQLTTMSIGVLSAVLVITFMVALIYLVLTNANNAAGTITLTASPSGGIPPYSYIWSNGGTCSNPISGQTGATLSLTGASGTLYSVEIIDSVSETVCNSYSI